jgi:hypothetical protein
MSQPITEAKKVWILKNNGSTPEQIKAWINNGRYELVIGPAFGAANPLEFENKREEFITVCNKLTKENRGAPDSYTLFGRQQWDLCWAVKKGDRVILVDRANVKRWKGSFIVSKGTVLGNYRCEKAEDGLRHIIDVRWDGNFTEIAKDSDGFQMTMLMLIDATNDTELLSRIGETETVSNITKLIPKTLKPRPEARFEGPLNIILCGPPGTGKTYQTVNKSLEQCHSKDDPKWVMPPDANRDELEREFQTLINEGRIEFVTFHQSYDYGDFIQGIRPSLDSGNMTFNHVPGPLKRIADRAAESYNSTEGPKPFVLIIDEINRGNLSKIFGELITLIEEDKRGINGYEGGLSISLLNPSTPEERFYLPPNLYIIGTLNSADRSIQRLDSAMRRRFEFIEVMPIPDKLNANPLLASFLSVLNDRLRKARPDSGCLVGHAWLMDKKGSALTNDKDICRALNNKVIPLLREWFWDQSDELKEDILTGAKQCYSGDDLKKIDESEIKDFLETFK